jgi:hypothetical protein
MRNDKEREASRVRREGTLLSMGQGGRGEGENRRSGETGNLINRDVKWDALKKVRNAAQ